MSTVLSILLVILNSLSSLVATLCVFRFHFHASRRQLTDNRASPEKSNLKKSPTKPGDRRKSVSFSQDTKTEDGDTAQNAFKAWVAEQNALEAGAEEFAARIAAQEAQQAQTAQKAAESDVDPIKSDPIPTPKKETKEKKEKRDKKEKKDKSSKSESAPKSVPVPDQPQKKVKTRTPKQATDKPVPEYVHYLTTYHTDRASWKFNKSKQNDLLKNVWNIYRVPSEHNDALVEYISGLQGNGARQRLQDAARTIATSNVTFIRAEIPEVKDEKMDTVEARRAAFDAAEKRELDKLRELGIDLGENNDTVQTLRQKREEDERATQLLQAILGHTLSEMREEEEEREGQGADTARARKKKRKTRTVASDSESSSDDDSSDSDSDATAKPSPKKKNKTVAKSGKDSASSSSSSSDSDSDSSDSSDSDSDKDSGSDDEPDKSSSDDDESSSSDSSSDDDSSDSE